MKVDWSHYDGVEVISDKVSGIPLLKGTRVPADLVAECLAAGETVEEIAFHYDLDPAAILRLRAFTNTHMPAFQH